MYIVAGDSLYSCVFIISYLKVKMDTQIDPNPSKTPNTLIPLPTFKKSGRCPLEPYHLLFHHKGSLVESGAFIKFGKRWLVDESKFFDWLREHGEKGSHHTL